MTAETLAKAYEFSARAHAAVAVDHRVAVAMILGEVPHTTEMLCAALLHDVVEDCGVTPEEIREHFGPIVEDLVFWLTDPPTVPGGPNRAARKAMTRERYSIAPAEAQTIKCADIISNTSTIREYDPDFAVVYLSEVRALLEVLDRAHPVLLAKAKEIVNQ